METVNEAPSERTTGGGLSPTRGPGSVLRRSSERLTPARRPQWQPQGDRLEAVSAEEVDEYLRSVEEPKRSTLQTLRRTILEIVPDAEEVISYGVPAFRVRGETVAGFAAFKNHLSYLPFSGSVLGRLADELRGYTMTKSALHFPIDRPLPKALVEKLLAVRLGQSRV